MYLDDLHIEIVGEIVFWYFLSVTELESCAVDKKQKILLLQVREVNPEVWSFLGF